MVIFMFYYLNMFLIGSILGFIWETGPTFVFPDINNGLLFGPWVPVYGFGICIIIFIERLVFNRIKVKRFYRILIMLLFIMVVVTGLEFLGGILIEKIFDKTFWDYSHFKFNIGKYIALEVTLLWGVMALGFVYVVKPLLERILKKIPIWASIMVFLLMIIDFIFTCLEV